MAHSILNYKLHRGLEGEEAFLDKSLNCISNAENLILQNSTFDKTSNKQLPYLPDKIFALVHFGRSGTGLLHQPC